VLGSIYRQRLCAQAMIASTTCFRGLVVPGATAFRSVQVGGPQISVVLQINVNDDAFSRQLRIPPILAAS
jgi:hypothetical protein